MIRSDVCEALDPRIRRTRQLLQQALVSLLDLHDFEKISVQDIAERATVNRATFYDHYPDKFSLLEAVVSSRFHALLATRKVELDGTCASGLKLLIHTVCDYLVTAHGSECPRQSNQLETFVESTIVTLIKGVITKGMMSHSPPGKALNEMAITAVSWAIYGVSREWANGSNRSPSDTVVESMAGLIHPLLNE